MTRRTTERVLADAVYELAEFAADLWKISDGDPGNANGENFELAVRLLVDVLRAMPPVLRRHPELLRDGEFPVTDQEYPRVLAVTPDGRVLDHGPDETDVVRLDRTDLSRRIGVDHGHGFLDRERQRWPSCPLTQDLVLTLIHSPLLAVVAAARPEAAEQVRTTVVTIERTGWLDDAIQTALRRGRSREALVAELQPKAYSDVGTVYDLLQVQEVMAS